MAIKFVKVKDKDFEQIVPLYHYYLDIQNKVGGRTDDYWTAEQMKDVYNKKRYGIKAKNYDPSSGRKLLNHYGWVAKNDNQILAYIEWAGDLKKNKTCACFISVWEKGCEKEVEDLLVYSFDEMKKLGFKLAVGHFSWRMQETGKFEWMRKYAHREVEESNAIPNASVQLQRDL